MAAFTTVPLIYFGADADENKLNFYDASASFEGAARTLAILGHYYLKQEIIVKAPNSAMPLFYVPPQAGSLKQDIIAGAAGGLIVLGVSVPFTIFATRVIDSWIPPPASPELLQMVELLKEQNALLRRKMPLGGDKTSEEAQEVSVDAFIKEKEKDLLVVRSVVSQSFKKIYRPISSGSANHIGIVGGQSEAPTKVVDREILGRIEADAVDDRDIIVMGVVSSFSRGSKSGVIYSHDYMARFRVEYVADGKLPREDDFSWSQFSGKPIKMFGKFVRFFDGKVKKLLVYRVERVTNESDIKDYFDNEREVRKL
jgi:hypothetical protein